MTGFVVQGHILYNIKLIYEILYYIIHLVLSSHRTSIVEKSLYH